MSQIFIQGPKTNHGIQKLYWEVSHHTVHTDMSENNCQTHTFKILFLHHYLICLLFLITRHRTRITVAITMTNIPMPPPTPAINAV